MVSIKVYPIIRGESNEWNSYTIFNEEEKENILAHQIQTIDELKVSGTYKL